MLRRFLGVCAIVGFLAVPAAAQASGASCSLSAAFSSLQLQVPNVGQCAGGSYRARNGDALQPTSGGLLVFRQATSSSAFTDGYHTWAIGPQGLQERLNSQRFSWEEPADMGPVLGVSDPQTSPVLRVVSTTIGAAIGPLRFQVAGSGFQPHELVTLRGTYTPLMAGPEPRPCRTLPLGPVRIHADSTGSFTTNIDTSNPHTGVNYFLWATGEQSGPSNLELSVVATTC